MTDAALAYLRAGLCVLPAILAEKRPALSGWKSFQTRLPTEHQLREWFGVRPNALCIVTGSVSGNLELLDFDHRGDRFTAWSALIPPELLTRLVIETSQSGGRHVIYRCGTSVNGNMKLASGRRDESLVTLIETRGEGGLFLCAPTPGYLLEQGELAAPPVLTAAERETLLEAAWSLNEYVPPAFEPTPTTTSTALRPGDDFNERGDVREVLLRHGWTLTKPGENEYWRRPGKTSGWSATLKDRLLYVFSGNAAPFEPNRAYGSFAVYALLEHGGDFAAAASALRSDGFGNDVPTSDVDLSGLVGGPTLESEPDPPLPADPGPLPEELLRVPGFVSELMDHCLATAPYPNQVMAFAGALALQAFLAGRKVRDAGDNRTNLYLLGLAHSAAGKDWPRKLNTRILHELGLAESLGERFASGEGIQDALFLTPSMLFQTDEIDGLLQSINKSRDARHESIMSTLLTLYSSASSVFPMRRKAGKESPGAIDQPSLVIFGTAIPNHYYEALSERMLTNGFFARMLILECGRRGAGQEPRIEPLPPRILDTARWWADFRPGTGNLTNWHPLPAIVPYTPDALPLLVESRQAAEAEYQMAETRCDAVGTTVWGRVSEQVRKLALVHAISATPGAPEIDRAAVEWAVAFVMHQTRRMLHMAAIHVSDSEFEQHCKRVVAYMRDLQQRKRDAIWIDYRDITRRFRCSRRDHEEIRNALLDQELIEVKTISSVGRPRLVYRLRGAS